MTIPQYESVYPKGFTRIRNEDGGYAHQDEQFRGPYEDPHGGMSGSSCRGYQFRMILLHIHIHTHIHTTDMGEV